MVVMLNHQKKSLLSQLRPISWIGWLLVLAFIGTQITTLAFSDLSSTRNANTAQAAFDKRSEDVHNAIQLRVKAYIDTQVGFRGLYAASDYVDQSEFQRYYQTLDLQHNYPGIRALTFISRVDSNQLPAFVALRRHDTSLYAQGNPNFHVINQASATTHYIVTYNATTPNSPSNGTDLAGITNRRETFEKAQVTDMPSASATIDFAKTATTPASKGFFITVPLHGKPGSNTWNSTATIGYTNIVFDYKDLFQNIFQADNLLQGLVIEVVDAASHDVIYQANQKMTATEWIRSQTRVPVADRSWLVAVRAPSNIGMLPNQQNFPKIILGCGEALSILLIALFVMQSRSGNRAFALASVMTTDLARERNNAVSLQRRNQAILSALGEGLIAFDHEGKVELVNAAAERLLGFRSEELVGQNLAKIVGAEEEDGTLIDENKRPIAQVLADHKPVVMTLKYIKKNGQRLPVQINIAPILSGRKVVGAIEVFRDVTREREIDKTKTEFVSLASHQLRTPLSTISWYAEMLLAGDAGKLSEEQKKYLDEIYRSNHRMTELVGSLLNVSRLDLGTFSVDPVPTNIVALAQDIVHDLEPRIFARKIDFQEQYSSKLPLVNVDPKLMHMVIENLASNAIKYTPEKGRVELSIDRQADHLVITVKDTGYGIPKAQQSKIFDKLFRADNVKAQDTEGTGLGLYLVKSIVTYSGGKIWFESVENKGTTFYVQLPIGGMKQRQGSKGLD